MTVFFLFYFLSFFIPADQTAVPEIYWSGALLIILLFRYKTLGSVSGSIGKTTRILWATLLCIIALGLLYSKSPAMTTVSLIRYIEGYAAFIIGTSWSHMKKPWMHMFKTYALIIIGIFLLCSTFPVIADRIPPYTSLFAVNGHHPFAAFLLLFLPFAVYSKRTYIVSNAEKIITTAGLLVSSARISWGIAFIFLCIEMYSIRLKKLSPLLIGIFGIALCGVIFTSSLPSAPNATTTSSPIAKRYLKDLNIGLRQEYIVQTLRAIKDSPFIGHGSGTFPLLSRQFSSGPGVFARYAHSFPLEVLSEHGFIGSLPIFLLFLSIGIHAARSLRQKRPHPELAWALILTIAYSLVDTNLNLMPIWILFWMIAGLLHSPAASSGPSLRRPMYGLVPVLGIVCLSGVASMAFDMSGRTYAAFIAAPYRKTLAVYAIQSIYVHDNITNLLWWHGKDPDISFGMNQYDASFIKTALMYDPYNYRYLQSYLTQAVRSGKADVIQSFLCNPRRFSPTPLGCSALINRTADDLIAHQEETLSSLSHLQGNDGLSKTLYFLGLSTYETTHSISAAIYLLEQARDTAPEWGYYHVALSSAQYTWEHNERAAMQTLITCKHHPIASIGCSYAHPEKLYPPESYASDIARIPEIQ